VVVESLGIDDLQIVELEEESHEQHDEGDTEPSDLTVQKRVSSWAAA
jgi:hypothetical protein